MRCVLCEHKPCRCSTVFKVVRPSKKRPDRKFYSMIAYAPAVICYRLDRPSIYPLAPMLCFSQLTDASLYAIDMLRRDAYTGDVLHVLKCKARGLIRHMPGREHEKGLRQLSSSTSQYGEFWAAIRADVHPRKRKLLLFNSPLAGMFVVAARKLLPVEIVSTRRRKK